MLVITTCSDLAARIVPVLQKIFLLQENRSTQIRIRREGKSNPAENGAHEQRNLSRGKTNVSNVENSKLISKDDTSDEEDDIVSRWSESPSDSHDNGAAVLDCPPRLRRTRTVAARKLKLDKPEYLDLDLEHVSATPCASASN